MRKRKLIATAIAASALAAGAFLGVPALVLRSALAEPAPPVPKPYQVVAIQLPQPLKDASFEAFRKQLAGIAQKRDKAALAQILSPGFFWIPDDKDTADKSKPPIENLTKAIGLDGADGWLILSDFAAEATADQNSERAGVLCAPGGPKFDLKAAEALEAATQTQLSDWAYPIRSGLDVRQGAAKNSRVIEKLGLHLVWANPDGSESAGSGMLRIVTPGGKVGFVSVEDIRQVFSDQICYSKEGAAWKIAGVIGSLGGSD